jgi:hypothetical protein
MVSSMALHSLVVEVYTMNGKGSATEKTADENWKELYDEWKKNKAQQTEDDSDDKALGQTVITILQVFSTKKDKARWQTHAITTKQIATNALDAR